MANTVIKIDGKNINIQDWLTTIQKQEETKKNVVSIEIPNYSHLGFYISSLINVSRVAIENQTFDVDKLEISRVLELANNLIPFCELEFLDKLNK